jgi:hypothetical protein
LLNGRIGVRIGDFGVLPKTGHDASMNEAKHWNSSQGDSDDGTVVFWYNDSNHFDGDE